MALVVAVLLALFVLDGVWAYAAIAAGVAVEVGEAAFWWRWTHRRRPAVGVEALVGATAVVVAPCEPDGTVRIAGELWSAHCDVGATRGQQVVVRAVDGLVLQVDRP